MRNRVSRGLIALTTVVALLAVYPTSTASADTITAGDSVCSMYVNSIGFGAVCSSSVPYIPGVNSPPPPTWRERLNGNVFIPCRDFPIPEGIKLGKAPDGKSWVLRVRIEDYNLDKFNGGDSVHLERMFVPVSGAERDQCRDMEYMDQFWREFGSIYPPPALQIKPTYTPRVNVPAYFSLTRESSMVLQNTGDPGAMDSAYYDATHNLTMRGLVTELLVDPGDGTAPFTCALGVGKMDDGFDGYDEKADPFHQMSTCSHKYQKSSASQPDGMYTVKLKLTWTVSYWKGGPDWVKVGTATIDAVQRLPVQEVQSIGG
ncbi:hypothetical protein AB0P21_00845 [Kribbella sp. NPDC056861]|uniref:hypothetical protein n=1 Tax=Kribbella sp. NPDC056861 TaxID=3154857 RepID=UPI00342E01EC